MVVILSREKAERIGCVECGFGLARTIYTNGNIVFFYWQPREFQNQSWIEIPAGTLLVLSGESFKEEEDKI